MEMTASNGLVDALDAEASLEAPGAGVEGLSVSMRERRLVVLVASMDGAALAAWVLPPSMSLIVSVRLSPWENITSDQAIERETLDIRLGSKRQLKAARHALDHNVLLLDTHRLELADAAFHESANYDIVPPGVNDTDAHGGAIISSGRGAEAFDGGVGHILGLLIQGRRRVWKGARIAVVSWYRAQLVFHLRRK